MLQTQMTVKKQTKIAADVYELVLTGENIDKMEPGQFLMLRPSQTDLLLRRPISICAYDKAANTCTLIYRVQGEGTKDFSTLQKNDTLDCLGPLGTGFDLSEAKMTGVKEALLIGGGIGVPPMYQLGKELVSAGINVTFVNGFESQKDIFYEAEMAALGDVHISTVDGSYGTRGFVTDITTKLKEPDRVYSCGPKAMLKAVKASYQASKTFLSLEERMACGIGACYACVCPNKKGDGWLKVCENGPVFRADEVEI